MTAQQHYLPEGLAIPVPEPDGLSRPYWEGLRANRLAGLHFRRQQVIDGFIVDFYCHSAGVVIELDGPIHLAQADYDEARSDWLRAHDLRVLRFANAEVEADLPGVLARIREACGR